MGCCCCCLRGEIRWLVSTLQTLTSESQHKGSNAPSISSPAQRQQHSIHQQSSSGRRQDEATKWFFSGSSLCFEFPSVIWHYRLGDRKVSSSKNLYRTIYPNGSLLGQVEEDHRWSKPAPHGNSHQNGDGWSPHWIDQIIVQKWQKLSE